MKNLKKSLNFKSISRLVGITIGIIAVYLSLKNIQGEEIASSLKSINPYWILPIIVLNFIVIGSKALRWQIMIQPVKKIKFVTMFRVLLIGFMANTVLPARLGEAVRVHILGRDAEISRTSTAGSVVADKIIEGVSFLFLAALLTIFTDVPEWMQLGLKIAFGIIVVLYAVAAIYLRRKMRNSFLIKLQTGIKALLHMRLATLSLLVSFLSWFLQGLMLYMTQIAFGVHLPIWGVVLVLLAINLAVSLPSAPGYVGTFELASILAYTYLGLDKSTALLIGVTFHILQIVPVTLIGGILMLTSNINLRKAALYEGPGESR